MRELDIPLAFIDCGWVDYGLTKRWRDIRKAVITTKSKQEARAYVRIVDGEDGRRGRAARTTKYGASRDLEGPPD